MCNFGTLYYYELKKILQKKMVWITWGIIFGFVVLMAVGNVLFESNEENGQKISAYEKMITDRENARALSGRIIDDTLLDEMKEAGGRGRYDAIYQFVRHLQNEHEAIMNTNAEELYRIRADQIATWWKNQKLTEGEIAYWQEKEENLKIPFTYEYAGGFGNFLDLLYNMNFFLLMLIVICLSGVFADEHLRKTDQVILGSRFGKKILYFAKLAAGGTFGVVSTAVFLITGMILSLAIYGADGFKGAIQLILVQSSWQLSIGETILWLSVLLLLLSLFYSVITLFLSEGLRSSVATMALVTGVFTLTFFLNIPPYQHRALSQILAFMPAKIMRANGWADMRLVSIFGKYLMACQFAPVLYLIAAVLLILIGKRMYEHFQVGGR